MKFGDARRRLGDGRGASRAGLADRRAAGREIIATREGSQSGGWIGGGGALKTAISRSVGDVCRCIYIYLPI